MYKDKRGVKFNKLTLEINYFVSNNELKNYLLLVKGVSEVNNVKIRNTTIFKYI